MDLILSDQSAVGLIISQNFHVSVEMHVCQSKKNITIILFIYEEGMYS